MFGGSRRLSICHALFVTASLLMLTLMACSEGPGDQVGWCTSSDPSISNFSLTPNSAVLGEGSGSVDVEVTFDYRMRDGTKILLMNYRLVDESDTRVINESVDVADLQLRNSGTYEFSVPVSTQTAQSYRFRLQIIDQCFSESNWTEVNFAVIEPVGLSSKADFGVARLNRVLYVIGGRNAAGDADNTLIRIDPKNGVATKLASMPEGRFSAAIATYDSLIFVFGGSAFGYVQDSTLVYDSAADSWTARVPMPGPIAGAHAYEIDGVIYIEKDGQVDRYDPTIDSWTQLRIK